MLLLSTLVVGAAAAAPTKLAQLNIDPATVTAVGVGNSADFAHQFHIAFSATVSGACVFSGQPFNCAVSGFAGDTQEWKGKIAALNGAASSANDHCRQNPAVVDVGSVVDYPRRHCGQNPVSVKECFDDVNYVKKSRVFLFQGTHDEVSKPGTIENVDGLIAQMITWPQRTVKVVRDQAFGHVLPIKSTPYVGSTEPAGYDGPGECLSHVYDMPMRTGVNATAAHWLTFDQSEFQDGSKAVGFEKLGWVYVPSRCQNLNDQGPGSAPCKLVLRPGKCSPPTVDVAPDVAEFANYAEANGIVLLHPCTGGPVDASYTHAPDIKEGQLDVYGQLDPNYVQQSAPHMRTIGKMVRRVLGLPDLPPAPTPPPPTPPPPPFNCASPPAACLKALNKSLDGGKACCGCRGDETTQLLEAPEACPAACMAAPSECQQILQCPGVCPAPKIGAIVPLPALKITGALAAGCSNTADFSEQFHVAFSSIMTGSCIFSGMPYHSAVTRFPNDYMVAKSLATAAGINCMGCDANGTLTYDHAKNHPDNVVLEMLHDYAENPPAGHIIDDPKVHLATARVFVMGPTHDRCYQPPAMENVANFHRKYVKDAEQVKLVENQPFPHTLPTNDTAYYNTDGNSTGAGFDGPGECVSHVFGGGKRLYPVTYDVRDHWLRVNNSEYIEANNYAQGYTEGAFLFVPPQCTKGGCKLIVLPGGCNAYTDHPPTGGSDDAFARYGMANGFVILKPCQTGKIDLEAYPHNHENYRGMVDVYGQLSPLYATQKGGQMEPTGKMVRKLLEAP